jgi:hypothetical protein
MSVIKEIEAERKRLLKLGFVEIEDDFKLNENTTINEWTGFLRSNMIKAAATSVAAIEAFDKLRGE